MRGASPFFKIITKEATLLTGALSRRAYACVSESKSSQQKAWRESCACATAIGPFGLGGTYTHDDLYKISGKYIACPGCTRDDYDLGNCHLTPLLEEWDGLFVGSWQFPEPNLVPPKWQSIATRDEAHLNLVLNERNAIMGGCGSFRACPHKRLWGFSPLETRFGKPNFIVA